jgi:hypothetical protein
MYAYEGLGSVYWHMVGKLLLAVQDVFLAALEDGTPDSVVHRLAGLYHRIRDGFGFRKSAAEFGAFPTDPYSHTPAGRGAQQPGMTGLVKEEILTRRGELGVDVRDGRLRFAPRLLLREEFLDEPRTWHVPAGNRPEREVAIPAGGLAFLLCGVPVVYRLADGDAAATVEAIDGTRTFPGAHLDVQMSARVFARDPAIRRIEVTVPRHDVLTTPT